MLHPVLEPIVQSARSISHLISLPGKLRRFETRVPIRIEKGPFLIRTVESPKEFSEVLRLRYEVFEREFRGNPFPFGWDTDDYDQLGDHLIIIDQRTTRIVGNYRLISSSYSNRFYSDSEFEIQTFLDLSGVKLELGRACIHQDYRTGAVMGLLWRGIVEYAKKVKATYLFGCASVKTEDPAKVAWLMAYFRSKGWILDDERLCPNSDYGMDGIDEIQAQSKLSETENLSLIPPLLSSYFKAGANVAVPPAYDRYFKCVDFLTVLRMDRIAASYERRFGVAETVV